MEVRFQPETKEQAIKNLMDFKTIMEELEVPFFLMDGTLLGACIDHDFIHGDYDDIDVGVLHKNYDKLTEMMPVFQELGFNIPKAPFHYEGLLEGIAVFRGGNHIDIMRLHVVGNKAYNLARCNRPNLPRVVAYVYPAECFTSFDTIEFQNETFNTPHDTEKYLVARYDTNWREPVDRKDYDYLSPTQVPCLRTEWPREK